MASATIETKYGNLAYVPGEKVEGEVHWESDVPVMSAELRLFYFTEGRGTEDVAIVDRCPLDAVSRGAQTFAFKLPSDVPFTFSGKLVSVTWALELVCKPDGPTARRDVVVSPTGQEIDLYAHDDGSAPESASEKAAKWFGKRKKKEAGA